MAQQLLEYKCPACGASLQFDSGSQQVVCPYCDSSFSPQDLIDYDSFLQEDAKNETSDSWSKDAERWEKDEASGLNVYTCAACGGEAKVPFEPKSDRPVYCSECFAKMREQA